MSKISGFFRDVGSEMRKVSWPKRKVLTRYTMVVLTTVVFMAVVLRTYGPWYFKCNGMVPWVIIKSV